MAIVLVKKNHLLYTRVMIRATFKLGYLIGLIVGEGSFTLDPAPKFSMTLHVNDPQPLLDLRARFGGTIYGPYSTRQASGKVSAVHQWVLKGQALREALPVFQRYLPRCHKRQQFEAWMVTNAKRLLSPVENGSPTSAVTPHRFLGRLGQDYRAKRRHERRRRRLV